MSTSGNGRRRFPDRFHPEFLWLSTEEYAARVGCTARSVRRWCQHALRRGKVKVLRDPLGRWWIGLPRQPADNAEID